MSENAESRNKVGAYIKSHPVQIAVGGVIAIAVGIGLGILFGILLASAILGVGIGVGVAVVAFVFFNGVAAGVDQVLDKLDKQAPEDRRVVIISEKTNSIDSSNLEQEKLNISVEIDKESGGNAVDEATQEKDGNNLSSQSNGSV